MRIHTLTLYTAKLQEMAAFYARLGFSVHQEEHAFSLTAGASTLRFVAREGFSGGYHFAFNAPEHLMQQVFEDLRQKVDLCYIREDQSYFADFQNWNAHALYFLDPDGNIVEYIGRHNLNHQDAENLLPLSISEIGLVTRDVSALIECLKAQVGVDHFRPALADFAPLGTDEGLFIVSRNGRPWYPVGHPAKLLPLVVEVETSGGRFRMEVEEDPLDGQIQQL
ncbi:VOC family protein [Deinococcus cellulosilyticus]|uniref:VOC domain-containing protein n=1 Tax=Deinococcus cellulosilyticus (strain DSM 18568 / NBRC 106333 / KACC 11606 / 5516J-15) TaxID=1223518 RepID=A0A511MWE6_DEIC1|nr:hypothetical protein [Deinococcus cellulosilyticus]GEM44899.1 hypothetical protein DC3_05340 [Deinococcus cellulosilyticus NBRC 106333 = KACC 11606]